MFCTVTYIMFIRYIIYIVSVDSDIDCKQVVYMVIRFF